MGNPLISVAVGFANLSKMHHPVKIKLNFQSGFFNNTPERYKKLQRGGTFYKIILWF
jgi:hypothetical protein